MKKHALDVTITMRLEAPGNCDDVLDLVRAAARAWLGAKISRWNIVDVSLREAIQGKRNERRHRTAS